MEYFYCLFILPPLNNKLDYFVYFLIRKEDVDVLFWSVVTLVALLLSPPVVKVELAPPVVVLVADVVVVVVVLVLVLAALVLDSLLESSEFTSIVPRSGKTRVCC